MKAMNSQELDELVLRLQPYCSFELTNILYNEKALQLSLSLEKEFLWLNISLKPGVPFAFLGGKSTVLIKNLKKPLGLFAMTHLKGQCLAKVYRDTEKGRMLVLEFDGGGQIAMGLFPGGQNVFLQNQGKTLSAFKPKVFKSVTEEIDVKYALRETSVFQEAWQGLHGRSLKGKSSAEPSVVKKDLKKKRLGLAKMQEKLEKNQQALWGEVGEWLKAEQNMEKPPEGYGEYLDRDQPFAWNVENCFAQLKKNQKKQAGTLERIEVLKKEILALESGKVKTVVKAKSLLQVASAKGRTHELANGWRLFVGKSAKDNLGLLRRAKPWYLWMHIRDFPGAYGILERPRKSPVPSPQVMEEAAKEVAKQSVKGDTSGRFEVIFAECRFVRPIPKAKTGQVTYSHEKVVAVLL